MAERRGTVRDAFPGLLGRPVESVVGVERVDGDDDSWMIDIEEWPNGADAA